MNPGTQRFTIDGSAGLESRLAGICEWVGSGVRNLVPMAKLEAIVLAGGYGRGEGGVLRDLNGDRPYNDLEFYLFLKGSAWLNARRFGNQLHALGESLSPKAGVHIEFKIDSLAALRQRTISMFSYDLVARHRRVWGSNEVFSGCEHHRVSTRLPNVEATRLLLNRCTGLLLAQLMLTDHSMLLAQQQDFIGRNLAKLRLGLGDAVLTVCGEYHWSCLERQRRLQALQAPEGLPEFDRIRRHHQEGVEFKLHPYPASGSKESFLVQVQEASQLAFRVWVWLESRRLGRGFSTAREYAMSRLEKCGETSKVRNYLLNLRTFGPKALLSAGLDRYARERLFNSLPLLLWQDKAANEPEVQKRLQEQLMTKASDWRGWFAAYQQIWPQYG